MEEVRQRIKFRNKPNNEDLLYSNFKDNKMKFIKPSSRESSTGSKEEPSMRSSLVIQKL